MSVRNALSQQAPRGTGREDAVDQVLRDFFRAAMPAPWPACKAPLAPTAATPRPRPSLFWSRFGLAASVALLLGSQLWLASSYRVPESGEAASKATPPVDVASKPQVSSPNTDPATGTAGDRTPQRPVLKNMR